MRTKLVLFAIWMVVLLGLVVLVYANAQAADEKTCREYGLKVELLVKQLTNDFDVAQAARDRGEAYCYVIDFPPVEFRSEPPAPTVKKKPPNPWEVACRARYRSFRASDGTVIPAGRRARVRCPLPG